MAWEIENFWNKRNSNWLDKNKGNINKDGRPRKGISLVNEELKEKGYEPATKSDIETNYMALLQLWEDELKALEVDKTKPMLIRILVKNMLSGKGFDIIEKMLDRWIWKPKQTWDFTVKQPNEWTPDIDKIKMALWENII